MKLINNLIKSQKPSATLAIKAKTLELKAKGLDIIDFSTGEPDFDTPDFIKDAAKLALDQGHTKYTAVPGIPALRKRLAEKFTIDNKIKTDAEGVIVCNGGKQAIHNFLEVVLEPGDEVIIPAPYWVSYPAEVALAGGVPVICKSNPKNQYKLTPAELESYITPRTKVLILNSPSNPTGAGYTKEDFQALSKVLTNREIIIMSDEVYEKITYGDFKFVSFAEAVPELADRTVTVNAFSKAYSMTGWRVGYATGPQEIISAMSKFQSQTTSNVCSFAQHAALAALNGSQDFIPKMNQVFWTRLQSAVKVIEETPGLSLAGIPEGAFYLFIRLEEFFAKNSKIKNSTDFCNFLLESAQVSAVPGIEFGDDGAFRISIAVSDQELATGMSRISKACQEALTN